MELTSLFGKYKTNIFSMLVIIVALIISQNIYINQNKNMHQIKEKKDAEIKKNRILEEISKSEGLMKQYKNYLNKNDLSLVINDASSMAKDSEVKIHWIKPAGEDRRPTYTIHPFELMVSADSYHAIGKFISKVESHPDLYFVNKFILQESDSSPSSGQGSLLVSLILSRIKVN